MFEEDEGDSDSFSNFRASTPKRQGPAPFCLNLDDTDTSSDFGTPAKRKGTLEPNFQTSTPKRQGPAPLCLNLDDTDTSSDFGTPAKRKGTLEPNFQTSTPKRQGPAPLCLNLDDTDTSSDFGSSFGECESTINLVDNSSRGLDVSDLVSASPSQPSCSRSSFGRSKGMYV